MKPTIFVVDDSATCRRPLERLLRAEGYVTRGAGNGVEAMDALQWFIPDLMLLDLSMPVMNGFEVLTRLRESTRLATLPVVVVTGETSARCEVLARALGARDVLKKSQFTTAELLRTIRRELPPEGVKRTLGLATDKADSCIMWTHHRDGALCELVTFSDGTIGVTRDKARIVSKRFTTDQFEECIDLLYNVSGRGLSAGGTGGAEFDRRTVAGLGAPTVFPIVV